MTLLFRLNKKWRLVYGIKRKSGCGTGSAEPMGTGDSGLSEAIMKNIGIVDTLNNIEIITDFKIEKDELIKTLEENRPTQKEIDDMSNNSQKEITPDEFSKKKSPVLLENKQNLQDSESIKEKVAQEEAEDFYLLVSIYGSILKNAELVRKELAKQIENNPNINL